MSRVVNAKFDSNTLLARKLVDTGDKILVEATTDKYWGASATINSKALANNTWKGANHLGVILMALHEKLKRHYPPQPANVNLEENILGLSVTDAAANVSLSGSQSGPSTNQSQQPVAPVRTRKRNNEVL